MKRTVASSKYKAANDVFKKILLQDWVSFYRGLASNIMFARHPDLQQSSIVGGSRGLITSELFDALPERRAAQ